MNHHDDAMGKLMAAITKWKETRSNADKLWVIQLIERHYRDRLERFCAKYVGADNAPDMVSDVMFRVISNLDRIKTAETFNSWIYRIAANLCIDRARYWGRRDVVCIDDLETDLIPRIEFEDQLHLSLLVSEVFERLQPRYLEVITDFHGDGMTIDEIAEKRECTPNTVKMLLHRARKQLRILLFEALGREVPTMKRRRNKREQNNPDIEIL